MDGVNNICFKRSEFTLYLVLIICILTYFLYITYYQYKEESELKQSEQNLNNLNTKISMLQSQIGYRNEITKNKDLLLNRIYNPVIPPERSYPGGRLGLHSPNQYNDYQQIGFVYNDQERYPLYGRPKYPRKLDKFEYYIIDETRNHLKIPYKSRGDNEIFDGEQIFIDVLNNTFTVKIYEYDNIRYNPDVY
jgi:type II secretory pathway pseudopilin PulG